MPSLFASWSDERRLNEPQTRARPNETASAAKCVRDCAPNLQRARAVETNSRLGDPGLGRNVAIGKTMNEQRDAIELPARRADVQKNWRCWLETSQAE
jgi:hypothetical protein